MFHESIHAYLEASSKMSELDHQIMAGEYVNKMATGIMEMYSLTSLETATALAWGGLQSTPAWQNLLKLDKKYKWYIYRLFGFFRQKDIAESPKGMPLARSMSRFFSGLKRPKSKLPNSLSYFV